MSLEETFATLQRLPSEERARLLAKIELWLNEVQMTKTDDVKNAVAVVKRTWAVIPLARDTMRWVVESHELEYDVR